MKIKTLLLLLLISSTNIYSHPQKRGHYRGGRGSSHKHGHYINYQTQNHYRKHKKV